MSGVLEGTNLAHWITSPLLSDDGKDSSMPLSMQLDTTYEPRLWRCDECKRVLGVVMRDVNRIRRLWIFWKDCSGGEVPATSVLRKPPKGLFRVHGTDRCHGVECSRCGALNEWTMSKESFDQLMLRYGKKVEV